MSVCDLYTKTDLRRPVFSAQTTKAALTEPKTECERTMPGSPARIVVLAPLLGSLLWAGLLYGVYASL